MKAIMESQGIESRILTIRGLKVMLDRDLASLYGVETRALKQAVRRNHKRFPSDFMFELTHEEFMEWRSQFVMSKSDAMGLRHAPMVFTEQGVAMLSSVLRSEQSIQVNIAIMRAFVRMRQMLSSVKELSGKFKELEGRLDGHDKEIGAIMEAIRRLMAPPPASARKIGFGK